MPDPQLHAPYRRLLVDAVAVYRLTRLVTADDLAEAVRARWIRAAYRLEDGHDSPRQPTVGETWQDLLEQDPQPPKLATLIVCRWCAGVYVSVGVAFMRWRFPKFWNQVADVAAMSAAAALLARLED